ncbi:hypothetical protein AGMMS50230_00870 [Spirochaetia bacterium]|nr:hypothetical protein AGMMS50230_00870 [Spirochaetia bacterium]
MKRLLPLLLIVIIAVLVLVIGFLLGGKNFGFSLLTVTEKSEVSAHTVLKEVLPIGEYASLAYHYTSVVKDVNSRDIKGVTIPFTTRKYIFTYDGIMKLGIDGSLIRVETAGAETAIRILLPPIKILSHEIIDNSIEVFEQSQTIFNQIKIEDAFKVTADRKRELEEKVMTSSVVEEAKVSAEQQFGALFKALPGIKEKYDLVFVWQVPAAAQ